MTLHDHPALLERLFAYLYGHEYAEEAEYDNLDDAPPTDDGSRNEEHGNRQLVRLEEGTLNLCHLHSSMYSLGDKYLVPGLKAYSLEKFRQACEANIQNALLPVVIEQLYNNTSSSDNQLCAVLVESICRLSSNLEIGRVTTGALEASHAFASDIAIALLKRLQQQCQAT